MEEFEAPVRFYPTVVRLPLWARPLTLRRALSTVRISEPKVRQLSSSIDVKMGLLRSMYRPDFEPTLDPLDILPAIKSEAPVDGTEIVEWMHVAAAENIVITARIQEYNRLGSEQAGKSGDGYIPGVVVQDCRFASQTGRALRRQGYGIAKTPKGDFHVPNLKKASGIFRDLITWASISALSSVQWVGSLLKWISLATTPIKKTVGFYKDSRGNVAPNFFVQEPVRPKLTVVVRQKYSTNRDQTLTLNFRDPTNYANVVGSKNVDIPAGTSEITYTVSAFPYVPPLIAEIQPVDGSSTKLEEYTVS